MKEKEALVLLNMGGPNNLSEVKMFLHNMFTDPNIITVKCSMLRRFIAWNIIRKRLKSSEEVYRQLGGKSPIVEHTLTLVHALQDKMEKMDKEVSVYYLMRYTPPQSDELVNELKSKGFKKVALIPLYPQFSTTTTRSSLEDFYSTMQKYDYQARIFEIKNYYEERNYNLAILERIKEQLKHESASQYHLVFSAHGLPQKIIDAGDPYEFHIERHVNILKSLLDEQRLTFSSITLAYQSKVGPLKWLEPSLDQVLETKKDQKVLIYPIAFTVDNSETEYELEIEYKEIAQQLNINSYKVARCVNSHPYFVDALYKIYQKIVF